MKKLVFSRLRSLGNDYRGLFGRDPIPGTLAKFYTSGHMKLFRSFCSDFSRLDPEKQKDLVRAGLRRGVPTEQQIERAALNTFRKVYQHMQSPNLNKPRLSELVNRNIRAEKGGILRMAKARFFILVEQSGWDAPKVIRLLRTNNWDFDIVERALAFAKQKNAAQ